MFLFIPVLWPCVCSTVYQSVTSECSIEMAGQIEVVFGKESSFDLFDTRL